MITNEKDLDLSDTVVANCKHCGAECRTLCCACSYDGIIFPLCLKCFPCHAGSAEHALAVSIHPNVA